MLKREFYTVDDIAAMKVKMVNYENWEKSPLLPPGWMFKKVSEGFTKDKKWYSTLHYLSCDGLSFENMKNMISHIKASSGYSQAHINNCKEFMQQQKLCDVK